MASDTDGRRRGFTLIEVLVAFMVLAISLGALFEVFSTGLRTSRTADESLLATLRAQSLLDGAGIEMPLAEDETQGAYADGSTWRIAVTPAEEFRSEPEGVTQPGAPTLVWVTATVFWGDPASPRSMTLKTLRFASQ